MSIYRTRLPPRRERTPMDSSLAIVNIVLLLIFFFLTTGSLSNSTAITFTLPDTADLPLDMLPKPLLTVTATGDMALDGAPIAAGTLADALIDDPVVHVLADRNGNAGILFDRLAAEKLVAVEVRLVTVHRKDAGAP